MTPAEIARYLGQPVRVIELIRAKRYLAVIEHFKSEWNRDGYAALKRYQNAVNRLLQEFERVFNRPAFYPQMKPATRTGWLKRIALIVEKFGDVSLLVKDIQAAGRELSGNSRPRTIIWFIQSKPGIEPRWMQIYWKEWERLEQEAKQSRDSWEPTDEVRELLDKTGQVSQPQWVVDARGRLEVISRWMQARMATKEQLIERDKIIAALKHHGHWDAEEEAL